MQSKYIHIIEAITNKRDWEIKINDKKITTKWLIELENQNCSKEVVLFLFKLLRKFKFLFIKNQKFFDRSLLLKNYNWFFSYNFIRVEEFDVSFQKYKIENDMEEEEENKETFVKITNNVLNLDKRFYISASEKKEIMIRNLVTKEEDVLFSSLDLDKLLEKKSEKNKILNTKLNSIKSLLDIYVQINDNYISTNVKNDWMNCINNFDSSKFDYQPWTDNQVMNYFHPSLYSYIKGYSKIVKSFNNKINDDMVFQWLATDVKVNYIKNSTMVENVVFKSSINNLPSNEWVIPISKILAEFIPLFNNLLKTLVQKGKYKYRGEKFNNDLKLEDCQFIIKAQRTQLSNLENKSSFRESNLHLEGTHFERIIGTGIYYFNVDGVNDANLNFKTKLYPKLISKEYYHYLSSNGRKNEINNNYSNIGSVPTKNNRCIVFPNFLYHNVDEIELLNGFTNGCREILVFWLVDPSKRILSTSNVLPLQQKLSYTEASIIREILMYERHSSSEVVTSEEEDEDSKSKSKIESKSESESDYNLCEH
jgi:hypothetical protein